jgi:hypothetical protein
MLKNAEKVPNFAARWRSIREYLIHSKASNQEKQCQVHQQNEKHTTHLWSNEKKFRPIESKPSLFSILLKTNKHTAPHIVQQNKNSNKEHFRTLNHHQKMTLALIKTNLKEPNHQYTTAANSSKNTEKPKPKNQYKEQRVKWKLTSQQLESAQRSAQKIPERNTGNADSKHARPAA